MTKKLAAILLAFILPTAAFCDVVNSTPDAALDLVNEYIQNRTQKVKGVIAKAAQDSVAAGVALQLERLEPEDFNAFTYHLTDRYMNNPQEREAIFALIQTMHTDLAADLANTRQLEEGPKQFMINGATRWTALILFLGGGLSWRLILRSPLRSNALVEGLTGLEARAVAGGTKGRLVYRVGKGTTVTLATMGAGAGVGYLQYVLEKNRAHRLDPAAILRVAQAELTCLYSYKGLDFQDRYDQLMSNPDDSQILALIKEMNEQRDQTSLLAKQFPSLDNLLMDDPAFQEDLQALPKAQNFQQLRKLLSDNPTTENNQCYEMSTQQLDYAFAMMTRNLTAMLSPQAAADAKKAP